jgi:hypothetical protein
MTNDDDATVVCSKSYLKDLLQDRYGKHIYFVNRPGRDDVAGFKDFCDLLLHDNFFSDRNEGEGSEAERLVHKAAGVILAEIREQSFIRDFYPTADNISCDGLNFLPPLLTVLVKRLIRSPLKQAALGQAIIQEARPQGCLMPLLFGVGVDLDHCGAHQAQMKLARLVFSVSTDEIVRYKQSVMHVPDETGDSVNDCATVTHFVADNVDHNVRTLDGLGTFHGMGIISATVGRDGTFGKLNRAVRQLPKIQKACLATRDKCMPILSFDKPDCVGLKGVELCAIRSLQQPIGLPRVMNLNCLWHAAGLLNRGFQPRPNWSGYMQSVCKGQHTGVSCVEMLSIVNLNPGSG